jgi:hypothetical protein
MISFRGCLTTLNIKSYFLALALLIFYNVQATHSKKYGVASLSNTQTTLESCLVPTGRASYCVPKERCKEINALFQSLPKPRSNDVANFLNSSFRCPNKTSSNKTLVCCPVEDITNPPLPQRPRFGNTGNKLYKIHVGDHGKCYHNLNM